MLNKQIQSSIVSVEWLKKHLGEEHLVVLDASMKPVTNVGKAISETYIPNSLRFDFDNEIKDHNTSLPHMMPSPDFFTDQVQKLGINQDSFIVVYDNVGIYASPRAWWMFRAMGHEQVAVLNGGLPAWMQAGYPTTNKLKEKPGQHGNFISMPQAGMFVNSDKVMKALQDESFSVMDARSEGRFKGLEPEPREGMKRGHMPNAVNLPFTTVLENGMIKSKSTLQNLFEQYKNKKLIFSCGTGVTACILALAADQIGYKNLSVYDGSWAEWGAASSNLRITNE
jgi:thiosulfate/3-mercaptopyruvate sulfurtransferase